MKRSHKGRQAKSATRRAMTKPRALKARFDAIHEEAMGALRRHDYAAFGEALQREHDIIKEVDEVVARNRKRHAAAEKRRQDQARKTTE